MSAEIIVLAEVRARHRRQPGLENAADGRIQFYFWPGASGKRYVHTVYDLRDCPAVDRANYVLVNHQTGGSKTVLAIGHVDSDTGSLNLAAIRQRGAEVGANEVHIHLLATSSGESQAVEVDLRSALAAAI